MTTVPMFDASWLTTASIPAPDGCEHVIANCPPELKKYLAASPLAKVAVKVKVNEFDQVDPYVCVFALVEP